MLKIFATSIVLMIVVAANADISACHYRWSQGTLPDSGTPYVTYRLFVDVTDTPGMGPDDWIAAGLDASIPCVDGIFYQDPSGGNPPNPAYFNALPDMEFDSYYTSPADWPNTDYRGGMVGYAGTDDAPCELHTAWYDTVDTGNGRFVIAQITVLPFTADWAVTGHLQYAAFDTGGELFDYYFTLFDLVGDVGGDGCVDLSDLGALLAAYGTCLGAEDFNPDADLNGDTCVDDADLSALLANYGVGCPGCD